MADLSDVTAYLAEAVTDAVYPNGVMQPSVIGSDVRIFEGWPIPDQLDLDVAGKMLAGTPPKPVPRPGGKVANISVYPMQGMTTTPFQILDNTYLVVAPAFGMEITTDDNGVIHISGTPTNGEYLTVIADREHIYSQTGSTVAAVIAAVAGLAAVDYPSTSYTDNSLTIPASFALVVRQGAPGTLGKVTHRQVQSVMVTVWAPDHAVRSALAKIVDGILKQTIVATMPDTTQAKIVYSRTNQTDEQQLATIYRRDLIYNVEYATLEEFTGYVVTSFTVNVAGGEWYPPSIPPTVPALN